MASPSYSETPPARFEQKFTENRSKERAEDGTSCGSKPQTRAAGWFTSTTVLRLVVLGVACFLASRMIGQAPLANRKEGDIVSASSITYEVVPGFFIQDAGLAPSVQVAAPPARFGLLDRTGDYWTRFKSRISSLNLQAETGTAYKVLFLGRHGQGFHNVGEAKYGTPAWDAHWSLLNGDGTIVWGPDAKLTNLGVQQAGQVHDRWQSELQRGGGIPLPTRRYSSPLSRAARTLDITFDRLYPADAVKPLIMEGFREVIGVHTCDKRSSATELRAMFPGFEFEEGFTEEDELWKPDVRESDEAMDERIKGALDRVLGAANDTYITIVAHGGVVESTVRLVGHKPYLLGTGGVLPMVLKVSGI